MCFFPSYPTQQHSSFKKRNLGHCKITKSPRTRAWRRDTHRASPRNSYFQRQNSCHLSYHRPCLHHYYHRLPLLDPLDDKVDSSPRILPKSRRIYTVAPPKPMVIITARNWLKEQCVAHHYWCRERIVGH